MNAKKMNVEIELLSPLMHFGDELCGTMQTIRRMRYFVNNEYVNIPVFSGNALRGILRTLVMQDFFEQIGYGVGSISQNLFYTFFNGGSLKSGGVEDLKLKEDIVKNCPPLVLLGSAFGNMMTEGKLKCGILRPVCEEMNVYNRKQSSTSLYSGVLEEIFQTRLDRLKPKTEIVKDARKVEKETVQMKYEAEAFSAGTVFETEKLVEFASPLELSCACYMLELLKQYGHIGGKSSSGYGKIKLEYSDAFDDGKLYRDFLESNKEEICSFIESMEERLRG